MKLYSYLWPISFVFLLLSFGCGKSTKTAEGENVEAEQLIKITNDQFESDSMAIGTISAQTFEDKVQCNGYLAASTGGLAQVASPIAGIVESVNCSLGGMVQKGQTLCMVSGNDLMVMQQEFAETAARLKRVQADYERNKALYDEKIGAGKEFIATESEYKATKSKYLSLKLRLELLRLNVDKIENGDFYSSFPVTSPIAGSVTKHSLVLGQFVEQQKMLAEIVDVNRLQIQLSVFEKDMAKLKVGQTVSFRSMGNNSYSAKAVLVSIGKAVDPETKTVTCIAKIASAQNEVLINQSYIEALIDVNRNQANALPSDALLKSGKDFYILIVEKSDTEAYYLRKQKVTPGRVSNGYTEILEDINPSTVIIKGVYNLAVE